MPELFIETECGKIYRSINDFAESLSYAENNMAICLCVGRGDAGQLETLLYRKEKVRSWWIEDDD